MKQTVLITFITAIVMVMSLSASSMAQENTAKEDPWLKWGVDLTADLFANVEGGHQQGLRVMDNIDLTLDMDLSKSRLGLDETSLFIYGLGNQGGSISELAGDFQGISNIETENSWRIYELWLQKKFMSARSSVLFGLYDVNTEFNHLNSSQLFLNSSHGIDPTIAMSGQLGPSIFPYTSIGVRLKLNPIGGWVFQAAMLDGVPSDPGNTRGTRIKLRSEDGLFVIGEVGWHRMPQQDLEMNRRSRLKRFLNPGIETDHSISVGGWYYTRKTAKWIPGAAEDHEYGAYLAGEHTFELGDGQGNKRLQVFTRLGVSHPATSQVSQYLGGGMVFSGFLKGRPEDQSGVSFAHAALSNEYYQNVNISGSTPEKAETNFELTHLVYLNEHIQIQADLQWVLNPGFDAQLDNAWVIGTRVMISY